MYLAMSSFYIASDNTQSNLNLSIHLHSGGTWRLGQITQLFKGADKPSSTHIQEIQLSIVSKWIPGCKFLVHGVLN